MVGKLGANILGISDRLVSPSNYKLQTRKKVKTEWLDIAEKLISIILNSHLIIFSI